MLVVAGTYVRNHFRANATLTWKRCQFVFTAAHFGAATSGDHHISRSPNVTHVTAILKRKRLVIAAGFEVANTVLVQSDCAYARDLAGGRRKWVWTTRGVPAAQRYPGEGLGGRLKTVTSGRFEHIFRHSVTPAPVSAIPRKCGAGRGGRSRRAMIRRRPFCGSVSRYLRAPSARRSLIEVFVKRSGAAQIQP
jgi:hypothetical protein